MADTKDCRAGFHLFQSTKQKEFRTFLTLNPFYLKSTIKNCIIIGNEMTNSEQSRNHAAEGKYRDADDMIFDTRRKHRL